MAHEFANKSWNRDKHELIKNWRLHLQDGCQKYEIRYRNGVPSVDSWRLCSVDRYVSYATAKLMCFLEMVRRGDGSALLVSPAETRHFLSILDIKFRRPSSRRSLSLFSTNTRRHAPKNLRLLLISIADHARALFVLLRNTSIHRYISAAKACSHTLPIVFAQIKDTSSLKVCC